MKKIFRTLLAGAALMTTLALGGCGGADVAMVVNDVEVPQGVMNYYINYGKDYLTSYGIDVTDPEEGAQYMSLIEEQGVDIVTEIAVIRSMAGERGLTVDQTALSDSLNAEKGYFEDDEAWQDWLTEYQITENDVEWILEYQLLAEALYTDVNKDLTLSDEEAAAIYNANPENYDTYKYGHILISVDDNADQAAWDAALTTAQSAIHSIQDGTATFEDLAKQYNPDSTQATGGDLGQYITKNASPYVDEFSTAAFTLTEIGQITTEPVKTPFGYHIIKLLDMTTGLEDAKAAIEEEKLGEERYANYSATVEEAMNNVEITKDYQRQYAITEDDLTEGDNATDDDTTTEGDAATSGDDTPTDGNAAAQGDAPTDSDAANAQ